MYNLINVKHDFVKVPFNASQALSQKAVTEREKQANVCVKLDWKEFSTINVPSAKSEVIASMPIGSLSVGGMANQAG